MSDQSRCFDCAATFDFSLVMAESRCVELHGISHYTSPIIFVPPLNHNRQGKYVFIVSNFREIRWVSDLYYLGMSYHLSSRRIKE